MSQPPLLGLSMMNHLLRGESTDLFRGHQNYWRMVMVPLILKRKYSLIYSCFFAVPLNAPCRPMWYSWKGHDHSLSPHRLNTQTSNTHYLPTILNQRQTLDSNNSFTPLPPALHLNVLWPVFLKNVHPLVKIFFDWEVVPVIEKAQKYALALSVEEQALVNGIRFIATLTLSREECQGILSESKHEHLLHCQRSLEHALAKAEYTETTDKRVLQAFMLYIVSSNMHFTHALRPKIAHTVSHARSHAARSHISAHGHRQSRC
jgi:hypothetical protein